MTDTAKGPDPSLQTHFVPADVEGPLYERWVERGYFTADPESGKPPFSLVIPPPNVTGNLHLGHALEQSMMDALTRRARMRGFDAADLFEPSIAHQYRDRVLAPGGRRDAADLVADFLGRPFSFDAFTEWLDRAPVGVRG